MTLRVAVLTISDAGSKGERADISGDRVVDWVRGHGWELVERAVVPDETVSIVAHLTRWTDRTDADLILTTGGTGLAPRDRTPEATMSVLDRSAPGIAEALRLTHLANVPRAALSRGVAGIRGRTLIVNLPGSPGGVGDGLTVLDRFVEHAVALVRDHPVDHS